MLVLPRYGDITAIGGRVPYFSCRPIQDAMGLSSRRAHRARPKLRRLLSRTIDVVNNNIVLKDAAIHQRMREREEIASERG